MRVMKLDKYLTTANIEKFKRGFYVSFALVGFDFLVPRHHIFFVWDKIPGFIALYGLLSSIIIISVSKAVGHIFLMKREDYYD